MSGNDSLGDGAMMPTTASDDGKPQTAAPVLFLDMDGVLTCGRVHAAYGEKGLWSRPDPVGIQFLNRLWEATGCLVVVSSTWRKRMGRCEFEAVVRGAGWTGEFHTDWATPDTSGRRGDEIREWLSRNPTTAVWIALDDDRDYDEGMPLVLTDPYNGLSYQGFRQARALLRGEDPPAVPTVPREETPAGSGSLHRSSWHHE